MKKTLILSVFLCLTAGIAFAGSESGNLTVTTTIAASCQAPSPSGNLVLPFTNTGSLTTTNQAASDQVTVSVTCSGSPTIASVAFDDGLYAADTYAGTKTGGQYRAMRRVGSLGQDALATRYLGYKLYASKSTGFTPAETAGADLMTTQGATAANYTLALNDAGSSSFYVKGRIYDARATWGMAPFVIGGTYNDTVVMTISY